MLFDAAFMKNVEFQNSKLQSVTEVIHTVYITKNKIKRSKTLELEPNSCQLCFDVYEGPHVHDVYEGPHVHDVYEDHMYMMCMRTTCT